MAALECKLRQNLALTGLTTIIALRIGVAHSDIGECTSTIHMCFFIFDELLIIIGKSQKRLDIKSADRINQTLKSAHVDGCVKINRDVERILNGLDRSS